MGARRLWAGAEAEAIGRGGIAGVARAMALATSTVTLGRTEVRHGAHADETGRRDRRRLARFLEISRLYSLKEVAPPPADRYRQAKATESILRFFTGRGRPLCARRRR